MPREAPPRLEPDELVVSAVKPADDGDGIVVRFWNTSDLPVRGILTAGVDLASAERVNLLERRLGALEVYDGRTVEQAASGKQILSVRLRSFAGPAGRPG